MQSNLFVASVKVAGRVLRETSNIVTLPFGSEYAISLKNLNSRRAMVAVSVDGLDLSDGHRLIINANSSVDLSRFIKNGNLTSGNRFKFIERTAGIESHRGIKADDGLIRAEFWDEKEVGTEGMTVRELAETLGVRAKDVIAHFLMQGIFVTVNQMLEAATVQKAVQYFHLHGSFMPRPYTPPPPFAPSPRWPKHPHVWCGDFLRSSRPGFSGSAGPSASSGRARKISSAPIGSRSLGGIRGQSMGVSASLGDDIERGNQMASAQGMQSFNEAGITVPGSESHQQFVNVAGFPLESQSTVIVLQLRGEIGGVAVASPVTVQHKPTCTTCGKVNKAVNRFCSECGTALVLI